MHEPITHPVYRSLNLRKIIAGADRQWLLAAVFIAIAIYALLNTFVASAVMFLLFYAVGLAVAIFDPQIVLFIWMAAHDKAIYDAAKL